MKMFRTIAVAFSMFSRIPMPRTAWRPESMRYMLCAFPLVGVVIGAVIGVWGWFCGVQNIGNILAAAGLTLIPVAITGGIHLDGFSDTIDALASHAEPARKREILKDPHAGAFAIMGVCGYYLLYAALCTELILDSRTLLLLGSMHVLSRILSALSILCFRTNPAKGLVRTFREESSRKYSVILLIVFLLVCAAGMMHLDGLAGSVMMIAAFAVMTYLFIMSKKQFEGMSGDLAGYFLQVAELSMLAVIAGTQGI